MLQSLPFRVLATKGFKPLSCFQKGSNILLVCVGGYNLQVFSTLPAVTSGKAWDSNLWVSICP